MPVLAKASYGTDQAAFAYDQLGRETSSSKTINGASSAVARSYNDLNNLLTLNYPDNLQVAYTYNQAGQIIAVNATPSGGTVTTLVSSVTYTVNGQIQSITYGNGVLTTYKYDPKNFRLINILTVKGAVTFQNFTYTYDVSGNILSITDAVHTASQTFQYSKLNRLLKATGSYGAYTYSYDQIGNIIIKEGVTYTYSKVNAGPHAVTSLSDGTSFTYDTNGNMATMVKGVDTTVYTYDKENRLTQVKKNGNLVAEFSYDGDGGRTKKITYSTTTPGLITSITTYVGSLQEKTSLATVDHIYLGSQLVASINNGVITYAHQDHLGGTNVITNVAGVKTEVTEYKPYGEIFRRDRYGSSQEVAWYYFTGKKLDDETGLYYYGARYYNPSLGRFITPDTVVQSPGNPQTFNRYSYCGNNPINRVDPTGHSWKSFWKKWGDFISPLGRAIVTGDWKNFGYQLLNIATMAIGVVTVNPWMVASGALSYASRATSHIGGNLADGISSALGYAAIATAVIGTGVQIHGAWQASHGNAIGVDKLAGQLANDPDVHFADSIVKLNQESNILEKISQIQQVADKAAAGTNFAELAKRPFDANLKGVWGKEFVRGFGNNMFNNPPVVGLQNNAVGTSLSISTQGVSYAADPTQLVGASIFVQSSKTTNDTFSYYGISKSLSVGINPEGVVQLNLGVGAGLPGGVTKSIYSYDF